jgi:hypothetical protein
VVRGEDLTFASAAAAPDGFEPTSAHLIAIYHFFGEPKLTIQQMIFVKPMVYSMILPWCVKSRRKQSGNSASLTVVLQRSMPQRIKLKSGSQLEVPVFSFDGHFSQPVRVSLAE